MLFLIELPLRVLEMSERAIMLVVVVALLAVAFFFPYDNSDGYSPGLAAQRQPGEDKARELGPNEMPGPTGPIGLPDPTALENDPLSPQTFTGGSGQAGGGWSPHSGSVTAARQAQATAITTKLQTRKGGFGENVKLEGMYVVQLVDTPDAEPPTVTFHKDGTFTDHGFLSTRVRAVSVDATSHPTTAPADWAGTYDIHGFTLEVFRTDVGDPAMARMQLTISPVGDDEDLTLPQKLYIEGKIVRLKR